MISVKVQLVPFCAVRCWRLDFKGLGRGMLITFNKKWIIISTKLFILMHPNLILNLLYEP